MRKLSERCVDRQ